MVQVSRNTRDQFSSPTTHTRLIWTFLFLLFFVPVVEGTAGYQNINLDFSQYLQIQVWGYANISVGDYLHDQFNQIPSRIVPGTLYISGYGTYLDAISTTAQNISGWGRGVDLKINTAGSLRGIGHSFPSGTTTTLLHDILLNQTYSYGHDQGRRSNITIIFDYVNTGGAPFYIIFTDRNAGFNITTNTLSFGAFSNGTYNITTFTNNFSFDRIVVKSTGGSALIKKIILGDMIDVEGNDLPSAEIVFTDEQAPNYCIQEPEMRINFTIEAEDPEGDTIYYSLKDFQMSNLNYKVYPTTMQECGWASICVNTPGFEFAEQFFRPVEWCDWNIGQGGIWPPHNISQFNWVGKTSEGTQGGSYFLEVSGYCTQSGKYPRIAAKMPQLGSYDASPFYDIYEIDNNDEFNISLKGIFSDEIAVQVNVRQNGTNLTIVDALGGNVLFNQVYTGEVGAYGSFKRYQFSIRNDFDGNSSLRLNNISLGYLSRDKTAPIVDHTLTVGNTTIVYVGLWGYSGPDKTVPVFSTMSPSYYIVNKPGSYGLSYFVSDSVHQPDDYIEVKKTLTVESCGQYNRPSNQSVSSIVSDFEQGKYSFFGFFTLVRGATGTLCGIFENITVFNVKIPACTLIRMVLVLMSLVIAFGLGALMFPAAGNIAAGISMVMLGTLFFISALIISFPAWFYIITGMTFAGGFAMIVLAMSGTEGG